MFMGHHLLINHAELPRPADVVEERSEVKPVVVRAVRLAVIGGGHHGHLVSGKLQNICLFYLNL